MKKLLILFILLSFTGLANDSLKVMFYNVENLFDTKDDTLKNDNEFLPTSKKRWTNGRYQKKLNGIAKVILNSGKQLPDVIGLCEVENKAVLKDLIYHPYLIEQKYQIVHFESPDVRGIDVALLYKTNKLNLLYAKNIAVRLSTKRPTRDILHVKGIINKTDTVHFMVNHWPSRYGGKTRSEPKRMMASKKLQALCDSVLRKNSKAKIITMGDFNDDPKDPSIQNLLQNGGLNKLPNYTAFNGTLKYKRRWNHFDQFYVSNQVKRLQPKFKIIHNNWLLMDDFKYKGQKPNRTYFGPRYNGGISDHLPVIMTVKF